MRLCDCYADFTIYREAAVSRSYGVIVQTDVGGRLLGWEETVTPKENERIPRRLSFATLLKLGPVFVIAN